MNYLLITGSEGLIGKNLTKYLETKGFYLKFLDKELSPIKEGYGNILDKEFLQKALQGCMGVIHLAGVSRVIFGEQDPDACWITNVEGTSNVIEAALKSPQKPWIIYASSREVYGEQDVLPVIEDAPLNPINIYAKSKVAAEKKVLEARQAGISTVILRFSNVFGSPFDHKDRVIPAFCRAALLGETLFLEGQNNVFDFTFIDDVVRGITDVIFDLMKNHKSRPPIHFTTGRGITLREAAHIIIRKANSFSEIKEIASRSFDVHKFYGDSSRAKGLLEWTPYFTFEQAVEKFLPLLKTHLRIEENIPMKEVS